MNFVATGRNLLLPRLIVCKFLSSKVVGSTWEDGEAETNKTLVFEDCFGWSRWPTWTSIPSFSKWLINSGEKLSKGSLESNRMTVSSESLNKKLILFVVDLHPVQMKSFLVMKIHKGLSSIFLHVIMMAAMNIVKSIGPSMSPCFTPIMLLRTWVTVPTGNLTLTFLWRDFKMAIIFGGKPNLCKIIQRRSRVTISNTLN